PNLWASSRRFSTAWTYAHITYYGSPNGGGTEGGACGYQNTYSLGYGFMTAALSSSLFQGGSSCGACYQIRCEPIRVTRTVKNWCWSYSRTITVTAINLCPPRSSGGCCNPPLQHFDLPMPAFLSLARREVRSEKRGGIRFTMGGNLWFLTILIHNVGGAGDVRSVRIKSPHSGLISMYRNWGSLWTVRARMSGALFFMITTSHGRVLITRNAVGSGWRFGQTWEGNFP
uniref:Expansin n=2 Tax=Physcomitrium patens TaxID=3218 RepID=A0A7I4E7C1_PHYPA